MNQKLWTKVLATFLVFTLTCANFILLGMYTGSSYATSDELEKQITATNNANVEFDAYFKDEKGNKTHQMKQSMSAEGMRLYLSIQVKKGYLKDAQVQVLGQNNTSSNFKITNSNGTLEMIENLDTQNNTVSLKQLSAGTQVVLEIPIIATKDDSFDLSNFSKLNEIKLTGSYVGDSGKTVGIEKMINTRNEWVETANAVLEQQVTRFIPYQVKEKFGTILQTVVRTGLENNNLPIEETKLTIKVPEVNGVKPGSVEVTSNGTKATNGQDGLAFTKEQWNYDSQTGIITIDTKNEANQSNQVSWNKADKDEYVITYIFADKLDSIHTNQETALAMKAYNSVETRVEASNTVEIINTEKLGDIVNANITGVEQLSKGFLYTKAATQTAYDQKVTLDVSYIDLVDGLAVEQGMDYFVNEKGEISPTTISNINYAHYKTTKISKLNFEKILGADGFIKISSTNAEQLAMITKDTPVDENGDFVIDYDKEVNAVTIETSKPVQVGKLEINHTKLLKGQTDYSKSQIASFKTLKLGAVASATSANVKVSQAEASKEITLVDPTTKVEASINVDSLSTVVKNENVELRVILKNSDITCDLYKNPMIEMVLPNYIKELNIKDINLLFDDELKIKDYNTYVNEAGNIVIRVKIDGEQTKYNQDEISKGANLVINTDMILKQLTPTKDEVMKVYVTNENATSYEQIENIRARSISQKGYTQVSLRAVAPVGMVTTNTISEYNSKNETITSISGQTKVGKLEVKKEAKVAKVTLSVINNYSNKVNNVSILGRLPFEGNKDVVKKEDNNSNLTLSMASAIKSSLDPSKVTIYYTTNAEATKDVSLASNGWSTSTDNIANAKSYLIVLNDYEVNTGDTLEFTYLVQIPGDLGYNKQSYTNYVVYYNNIAQEGTTSETAVATKVGLETGDGPELEVRLSSSLENGKTVEESQIVKYKVSVRNIGKTDLKNVTLTANVPNKTIYTYFEGEEGTQEGINQLYDANKKEYSQTIPSLAVGEVKTMEYLVEVQNLNVSNGPKLDEDGDATLDENGNVIMEEVVEEATLSVTSKATVKGYDAVFTSNQLNNKVVQGYINVKMEVTQIPESFPRDEKDEVTYRIILKNTNTKQKENVVLTNEIPNGLTFKEANNNGSYDSNSKTITWNVGTLKSLEDKTFFVTVSVDHLPNDLFQKIIANKATVKTNEKEVTSEEVSITVQKPGLTIIQSSDTKSNVSVGDTIIYNITLKNVGSGTARSVKITDILPEGVRYESAQYSIEGKSYDVKIGKGNPVINIAGLNGGSIVNMSVKVVAEKLEAGTTKREITNIAKVQADGVSEILSNSITHTIVPKDGGDIKDPSTEVPQEGTYTISGVAWLDSNNDGKRDDDETRLPRIPVMLINAEDGKVVTDITTGKEKKQDTSDNGEYVFANLKPGKYMVIFLYDSGNYGVTAYQQTGVNNDKNSDVIQMKVTYEGKTSVAGVSNTIEIMDENIGNIDIGLVSSPKFDLSLDKVITKITTSDAKGTKSYDYKDAKTAKLDLNAKTANGTNIVIEYKIKVTNEGGVAGYAKKVVDYIPQDMKFSSELNKDWYTSDNGNIYNSSLANTLIQPGETKELTVLLTKKMTNDNMGIINNTAEIQESYNDLGLSDIDSTPGNKVQTEDDISSADAVISIKTGEIYIYISLIISTIGILGVGIYLIKKKVLKRI